MMTTRFECFLAASLSQVEQCIKRQISPVTFFEMQSKPDDASKQFRLQFFQHLDWLYGAVARSLEPNYPEQIMPGVEPQPSDRRRDFRSDEHEGFDYGNYISNIMPDFEKKIAPVFKRMTSENFDFTSHWQPRTPRVIFCFDEASALLQCNNLGFLSLRRALRHHHTAIGNDKKPFFAVLLDTNAKYSTFVPPTGADPSLKIAPEPRDHFAPIFEIPSFDVMVPKNRRDMLTPHIDSEVLFSFGRPLWKSHRQQFSKDSLMRLATAKLYGGTNTRDLHQDVLTSMISWRMPFNVVWNHVAERLVAHHMRMIYDINDERTILQTVQPSEPILAWVAFKEMMKNDAKYAMLKNFHQQCALGTIDGGDLGEITVCLILLFAFDKLQVRDDPTSQTLKHFFESLFGEKTIKNKARNHKKRWSEKVKRIWNEGCVFFTHFDRLQGEMSVHVLERAWARGAALISFPGTADYDMVIPVLLPMTKEMTCILVQAKNRKHDQMGGALRIEAMTLMDGSLNSLSKEGINAHFFIHMALRTSADPEIFFDVDGYQQGNPRKSTLRDFFKAAGNKTQGPSRDIGDNAPKMDDEPQDAKQLETNDNNKEIDKYVLVSCGLSDGIFPSLGAGETESKRIASLLQNLLRLKTADNFENLTPYQRNLAPISRKHHS
jgi:hypothetical protein